MSFPSFPTTARCVSKPRITRYRARRRPPSNDFCYSSPPTRTSTNFSLRVSSSCRFLAHSRTHTLGSFTGSVYRLSPGLFSPFPLSQSVSFLSFSLSFTLPPTTTTFPRIRLIARVSFLPPLLPPCCSTSSYVPDDLVRVPRARPSRGSFTLLPPPRANLRGTRGSYVFLKTRGDFVTGTRGRHVGSSEIRQQKHDPGVYRSRNQCPRIRSRALRVTCERARRGRCRIVRFKVRFKGTAMALREY